jgi:hypothetical protein
MTGNVEVRSVGLRDPNFPGIEVVYRDGKPVTALMGNAGMAGQTMFKVTPDLEKAIGIMARKDALGDVTKGEHVATFAALSWETLIMASDTPPLHLILSPAKEVSTRWQQPKISL